MSNKPVTRKDMMAGYEDIQIALKDLSGEKFNRYREMIRTIEGIEQELNSACMQIRTSVFISDKFTLHWMGDSVTADYQPAWIFSPSNNTYYPTKQIYSFVAEEGSHCAPLRHLQLHAIQEGVKYLPELIAQIQEKAHKLVKKDEEGDEQS